MCITLSLFSSVWSHTRRAPLEKKKKIKQTLFIPLSLTLSVSLVVVCLSPRAREQKECGVYRFEKQTNKRVSFFRIYALGFHTKKFWRWSHPGEDTYSTISVSKMYFFSCLLLGNKIFWEKNWSRTFFAKLYWSRTFCSPPILWESVKDLRYASECKWTITTGTNMLHSKVWLSYVKRIRIKAR